MKLSLLITTSAVAISLLSTPESSASLARTQAAIEARKQRVQAPSPVEIAPVQLVEKAPPVPIEKAPLTPKAPLKIKTHEWGSKFDVVKNLIGQTSNDKANLAAIRKKYSDEFMRLSAKGTVDMESFLKAVDAENKAYISNIIDEEVRAMGIDPATFSVFTMGSMARAESGLYTDLEIFFVVKEKNILVQYQMEKLAQRMSDRFFRLGEHPYVGGKGLRLDEAGNSPAHPQHFASGLSPEEQKKILRKAIAERDFKSIPFEGSQMMLVTPEELASYHDKKFTDKLLAVETDTDKESRKLLRRQDFLKAYDILRADPAHKHKSNEELRQQLGEAGHHLYGRPSPKEAQHAVELGTRLMRNCEALYDKAGMFTDYWTMRETIMNGPTVEDNTGKYVSRRQELAGKLMIKDGVEYASDPKFNMSTGKLGDMIDLKRELYRIPEQVLTNLGLYFNVGVQNGFDIIKQLVAKGVMDDAFAADAKELMNFAMQMNVKQQAVMKKQGFAIYINQEKYEKDLADLKVLEAGAQKKIDILNKIKAPSKELNKAREKLIEVQYKIHDIESVTPGKILSNKEVEQIRNRYLPLLAAFYDRVFEFLGDKGVGALKGRILNTPGAPV